MSDITDKPIRIIGMPNPRKGKGYAKYAAVALELNVWGFGDTLDDATRELEELVDIQLESAAGRGELDMVDTPADPKWFDLWEQMHSARQQNQRKEPAPVHNLKLIERSCTYTGERTHEHYRVA